MTAKETLLELVTKLPEESAAELLEMAKSLEGQEERDWRGFALRYFSDAYGDDEPDYKPRNDHLR